eukprot:6457460-Amphidinium_carterae.1
MDVTGWYSRKENDYQYQIKAGKWLERLGGQYRTIQVGHYMELKVAYKQKHKDVIENKSEYKQNHFHDYNIITTPTHLKDEYAVKMTVEIDLQSQQKRDPNNPPHQSRFFLFLVQHYGERLKNIFLRAGAPMEEYSAVLANYDRKTSTHFAKPIHRNLQAILSTTQTTEERERDLRR